MAHHNTIFAQMLKLVSRHEFENLANTHHEGQRLRKMTRWSQFVALSLGQLAQRISLRDICHTYRLNRLSCTIWGVRALAEAVCPASMNNNLTNCMKRCSQNCCTAAKGKHPGIRFALRTN